MAGEWLKFEASTPDKPEVFAITAAMGWDDPDLTVGKLLRVWRWFDQHTIEGNAAGVTLALLDRISGVTGFAQAMQKVGWLIVSEGGVTLPNFERHNGKTAKERALTAKRVSNYKNKEDGNAATVTLPLPREEKRREEVNSTQANACVDSPAKAPACPPCPIQDLIEVYHESLPELPRVVVVNSKREAMIRQRWREFYAAGDFKTPADGLECFRWYFGKVKESKFLTGRVNGKDRPFLADLEWLVRPTNFAKVVEGRYSQ